MSTITSSFDISAQTFPKLKASNDDRYEKASATAINPEVKKQIDHRKKVEETAKTARDNKIRYYSKVAKDGFTSIGTQLRGVVRKINNTAFALFGKNPLLTLGLIDDLNKEPKKPIIKLDEIAKFEACAPVSNIEYSSLSQSFTASTKRISQSLSQKFDQHVHENVVAAETTAKSIIDGTFMGPLQRDVQNAANSFNTSALTPDQREALIAKTSNVLLEIQGIVFSQRAERHLLTQPALEELEPQLKSIWHSLDFRKVDHPIAEFTSAVNDVKKVNVYYLKPTLLYPNSGHSTHKNDFQTPVIEQAPASKDPAPALRAA